MAKDAPIEALAAPAPDAPAPSRLDALRARLREVAPAVKLERIAADEKGESKAHVKASWANKRVSHVAEPPHSLDAAECAVLEVVIAHHAGASA